MKDKPDQDPDIIVNGKGDVKQLQGLEVMTNCQNLASYMDNGQDMRFKLRMPYKPVAPRVQSTHTRSIYGFYRRNHMFLGIYSVFGYLDPQGRVRE